VIAADQDSLIPIEHVREAFARAGLPKRLIEHPAGHFDFYPGERLHAPARDAAVDWFREHL
jgi:fermentation-respiration switch protein FrsA (DUF1100 family)